jgi:hypothetical protein
MPRNSCAICAHPSRDVIDRSLLAGAQLKVLSATHGVSAHSLSRHKARHLATAPASDNGDSLQAQISLWRERADQLWQCASADQDVRGQASALAAGLRSCESQMRQIERAAEVAPADDDAPFPIQKLDRFVQALISGMANLQNADERVMRIAAAMIDDSTLLNRAKALVEREKQHDFIPQ